LHAKKKYTHVKICAIATALFLTRRRLPWPINPMVVPFKDDMLHAPIRMHMCIFVAFFCFSSLKVTVEFHVTFLALVIIDFERTLCGIQLESSSPALPYILCCRFVMIHKVLRVSATMIEM
jgi:hypothetical protein